MIRVAICDDDLNTLYCVENTITQYAVQNKLDFSINKFSMAQDLEKQIEQHANYQVYVLDMLMPQRNGIEIGQKIRSQDEHAAIIYLTTSKDFAYQAFGVYAQRYLLKPLKENELYEAMDFAVSNALSMEKSLCVNTADGIQRIFYHEIEYVESFARAAHIFTTDNREIVSRLLRQSFEINMSSLLESSDFIQTHKSFIVNLGLVSLYDASQMTMRSGTQIPISKSRQAHVKRTYLKYISEKSC